MVLALGAGIGVAGVIALAAGGRGGHYRALPSWAGFWVLFGIVLAALDAMVRWVGVVLLALQMFASLRAYFLVAPVRPKDRYAMLAVYLAIPIALWAAWSGSGAVFFRYIPLAMVLVVPWMLSLGPGNAGLLDSIGRVMLGAAVFVYCGAHLALIPSLAPDRAGVLSWFGLMVVAVELCVRVAGRWGETDVKARVVAGAILGGALACVVGAAFAPALDVSPTAGAIVGGAVALAVLAGSVVTGAVADDLEIDATSSRFGRGAFLDRVVPAVFAAPPFYHALDLLTRAS